MATSRLSADSRSCLGLFTGLSRSFGTVSFSSLALTHRDQGRWKEAEELGGAMMESSLKVLGRSILRADQ